MPVDTLRERQLAGLQALLALSTPVGTERRVVAASSSITTKRIRVLTLLKDPALRGAILLMLSATGTGALSFVFWGFTTHHQNAGAVGNISAEVSSITFLAGVGSLSLVSLFARFLPVSGRHARRFIIVGYASAGAAGLIAATIFLVTPFAKGLIIGGESGSFTFVIFVVLNSVFNIQDGGLIGFGRFGWVPVENILVALARLSLLPVAAIFLSARIGVLWSWAFPMIVAIIVVNIFVIGPLPAQKKRQPPRLPRFGELGRLVAIGSAASAVLYAVNAFLPALVTHKLGSYQGGYFYVPWVITTMVLLLMNNITISMVREVVANPHKAMSAIRRSVALAIVLAILVMIVCLFLGSFILTPLGSSYGGHGAPLLRWAGLAMPATAVIALFMATCSIRQRLGPAFLVNLITSSAIIAGVMLLHSNAGISRVGLIYCFVQWTAAAVLSFPTFISLRTIARGQGIRASSPT
jgi:O-antigen/teichoic acid export membrane protein